MIDCASAMDYLKENDPSLRNSLQLAAGLNLANMNSEDFASLLASQKARNDFDLLEDEIVRFFDDLIDNGLNLWHL